MNIFKNLIYSYVLCEKWKYSQITQDPFAISLSFSRFLTFPCLTLCRSRGQRRTDSHRNSKMMGTTSETLNGLDQSRKHARHCRLGLWFWHAGGWGSCSVFRQPGLHSKPQENLVYWKRTLSQANKQPNYKNKRQHLSYSIPLPPPAQTKMVLGICFAISTSWRWQASMTDGCFTRTLASTFLGGSFYHLLRTVLHSISKTSIEKIREN